MSREASTSTLVGRATALLEEAGIDLTVLVADLRNDIETIETDIDALHVFRAVDAAEEKVFVDTVGALFAALRDTLADIDLARGAELEQRIADIATDAGPADRQARRLPGELELGRPSPA